jgi:hypothetical protein
MSFTACSVAVFPTQRLEVGTGIQAQAPSKYSAVVLDSSRSSSAAGLSPREGFSVSSPWSGSQIVCSSFLCVRGFPCGVMRSRNTSNSLGLRWTRSPRTSTILRSRSTLNCGLSNFGSGSSELDSSGRAVFYLLPNSRLVPQQFYRETERAGSRAALYCPQLSR